MIDDGRDTETTEATEVAEVDAAPTEATTESDDAVTEAVEADAAPTEATTESDDVATEAVNVDSAPPETSTESDYAVLEEFVATSPLSEPTTELDDPATEVVEVSADDLPAQNNRWRRRLPHMPHLPSVGLLPRLRLPRMRTKVSPKVVSLVLLVLVLISGGVASWVYFEQYRPDQQTDASVARAVVSAATEGAEAVLSYSSDTLDQDFATARTHLAGEFLSYYKQFTAQVVAPAAKQKSLKTTAHVAGAAVSELQADSAVVLVFVDQTTSIKNNPQPSLAVSSIVLRMSRINGTWLITKFTPI